MERGLVVGVVAEAQALEDGGHALRALRERQVAVANRAVNLAGGAVDFQDGVQVVDSVREALL